MGVRLFWLTFFLVVVSTLGLQRSPSDTRGAVSPHPRASSQARADLSTAHFFWDHWTQIINNNRQAEAQRRLDEERRAEEARQAQEAREALERQEREQRERAAAEQERLRVAAFTAAAQAAQRAAAQPPPKGGTRREQRCLSFHWDGRTSLIIENFKGRYPFPSDAFSLSFWVRTGDRRAGTLVSYADQFSPTNVLLTNINRLLVFRGQPAQQTEVNVNDGQWHHVVFTYDQPSGQYRIYKDGRLGTVAPNAPLGSSAALARDGVLVFGQIQRSPGGGFDVNTAYAGDLDEMCFFDRVLDAKRINDIRAFGCNRTCQGLVSHWSFDDCLNSAVPDSEERHPGRVDNGMGVGCVPCDSPAPQMATDGDSDGDIGGPQDINVSGRKYDAELNQLQNEIADGYKGILSVLKEVQTERRSGKASDTQKTLGNFGLPDVTRAINDLVAPTSNGEATAPDAWTTKPVAALDENELQQWLTSHKFNQQAGKLTGWTGRQLMEVSKDDLTRFFELDGVRLWNELHPPSFSGLVIADAVDDFALPTLTGPAV